MSILLPALTCLGAIDNLWSIYLGVNILRSEFKSEGHPFPWNDAFLL